jgi:uncharacterized protein
MCKIYITLTLLIVTVLSYAIETDSQGKNNAEIYFDNLLQGNYEACTQMSSSQMQSALPADKLQATWESLPSQVGKYNGVIASSTQDKKPYTVYTYALNFEQMVLDMQITLDDKGIVSGLFFTPSSTPKPGAEAKLPDYINTDGIITRDFNFDVDGTEVHGILTMPAEPMRCPVVLMLSGSGPNDADETVGPRKPFRDIANGLAKQGIATLRWNKRTKDYPEVFAKNKGFTIRDEYLPEVSSALAYLQKNSQNKFSGYYLLGHSLGAMMMPMAASELKNVAGFIMLAGNARPLEDLVVEQYNYIFNLEDMTKEKQQELDKIKAQEAVVETLSADKPAPDTLLLNVPKSYWLSLNNYKQVDVFSDVVRNLSLPFLILQGQKDYQVTMTDFNLWQSASEGEEIVSMKSYPDLDHLFMYSEGKSTPQSYMTPAFVSKEVIDDIVEWVKEKSK